MPIGILAAQLNMYLLTASVLVIVLGIAFVLVSLLALFLPYRQFSPKKMRHVS
jgi:Na+-transporting methylmalonyl-CoA/oxaloacetate decarboxylase gamma subunit